MNSETTTSKPSPTGAELIAAERSRQIEVEGFTAEKDDGYDDGELIPAAMTYLGAGESRLPGNELAMERIMGWAHNSSWPWSQEWWKPSEDPVRNLVKAGALIAAEIDRLQRAAQRNSPNQ